MRHVQAPGDDLVLLNRNRAAEELNASTDGACVRRGSDQSHGDTWGLRIVSQHERGRPETTHDRVEVAVTIEIALGDRVRDVVFDTEPPPRARVLERHVAAIAIGDVLELER